MSAGRITGAEARRLRECAEREGSVVQLTLPHGKALLLARAADLTREVEALEAERDALRAIIEGRTTPPTDAEIDAHAKAGGMWTCVTVGEWIFSDAGMDAEAARGLRDVLAANAWAKPRWWPLDSSGRPCAWPTTEAPRE